MHMKVFSCYACVNQYFKVESKSFLPSPNGKLSCTSCIVPSESIYDSKSEWSTTVLMTQQASHPIGPVPSATKLGSLYICQKHYHTILPGSTAAQSDQVAMWAYSYNYVAIYS